MKKVALHQQHLDAKAKMIAFAGFEMPVSFSYFTLLTLGESTAHCKENQD